MYQQKRTKKKKKEVVIRYRNRDCSSGWWFLWLLVFSIFLLLVFTFSYPRDYNYHYYHPHALSYSAVRGSGDCTLGEHYDAQLRLCAPDNGPVIKEMYDNTIPPCQSFYHHTCGAWIQNHTNEDRSFTYVYRKNKRQVQEIITTPDQDSAPYLFYRSCIDTLVHGMHRSATLSEIEYLREMILEPLVSLADLPVTFGKMAQYGFTIPFRLEIESHPTEPKMIPLLQKDSLIITALPDLDKLQVSVMASLVQEQLDSFYEAELALDEEMSFEDYILSGAFSHDIVQLNKSDTQSIFWRQFFMQLGGPGFEHDLLFEKEFWIPALDNAYIQRVIESDIFTVDQWRAYVEYSIVYHTNQYMPVLHSDSYFREHERLHAKHKIRPHAKRATEVPTQGHCISLTNQLLPGIIAKKYLEDYFYEPEKTRRKITLLVETIRDQYVHLIHHTQWMSEETKKKAEEKIRNIIIRAVHPNIWETEPFQKRIDKQRYVHNLLMIRKYRIERNIELYSLFKEPNGRDSIQRFGAPLTTVNAFYSPVTNTITVFAGILTEPFYNYEMDDVTLYATVGMIVGHELSHAMDNSGRKFDSDGSFNPMYWQQGDIDTFQELTKCIVTEYGPPQGCENAFYGLQTLGEDIADITGITLAYNALITKHPHLSLKDKQRFFIVFSQMWAESFDQQHVCARVEGDVHAIARFRVDKTLKQLAEFSTVFQCKKGDAMYKEEKDRCIIY